MFDLRAALLAEIPTLSVTHVDTTVDYRSTEQAIQDVQSCVFNAAAVLLGSWRPESIPWTYGHNQVRNLFEVVVAVKSEAAKAAIDDIQRALRVGLERNNLGQADWRWTRMLETTETRKAGTTGIFYQIVTFEIWAIEASGALASLNPNFTLPSVTVNNPGAITVDGSTDITITAAVAVGVYTLSKCTFILYSPSPRQGTYSFYSTDLNIGSGTASVTWTTPAVETVAATAGTYGYWAKAIVVDEQGLTAEHEIAINITRT